jgi:hypothetical protein
VMEPLNGGAKLIIVITLPLGLSAFRKEGGYPFFPKNSLDFKKQCLHTLF